MIFLLAYCFFTPPSDWEIAKPKVVPKQFEIGFIDTRQKGFRPSLHLTSETVNMPMDSYLKVVQENFKRKKQRWLHLGKIATLSGEAELTEIESDTPFGPVRVFQAILMRDGKAYILTAGALKSAFAKQSLLFKQAINSLTITDDLISAVKEEKTKEQLREAWQKKCSGVESSSYEKMVLSEGARLGAVWQLLMLSR